MIKQLVLAACGILALSAGSASAQQRWPNWYLGIHADMAFIPNQDADVSGASFGDIDYSNGWGGGASLGYMPGGSSFLNGFRFEFEYTYLTADIDQIGGLDASDESRVNTFMANAFYDFNFGGFIPYVGAGAGVAGVHVESPQLANVDDSDTVFAWQLMAGIGYAPQLAPNTVLTLGYRYLNTDSANLSNGPVDVDTDFDSHNIQLGARFNF